MADDQELSPSDAELTASLRKSESDAPVDELYRRHRSAVFSYALACCRDPHTAEDLASEAFARTLKAVRSGSGPEAAWRPYLLTIVRRTAADWAATTRRTQLSPDFEQWLVNLPDTPADESSEERMLRLEDNSLVLRAFRSLPERWQTVLWHTAVEEEPAAKVGPLLGLGTRGVNSLAYRAREALREAYLAAHAESSSDTEECRHYSSLLGATMRRAGRRRNKDLDRHLAACERCRCALIELTDLNERLGAVLPTGVLLWGGSAYMAARLAEAGASAGVGAVPSDDGTGWWAGVKGSPLRTGAVAGSVVAAIAVTLLFVPMSPFFGSDGKEPASPSPEPPDTALELLPPVTHAPTPSRITTSHRAKPSGTPSVSALRTPSSAPSSTRDGLGSVAWSGRLINAGDRTLCLEPVGTAVVHNTCDSSKDQVWAKRSSQTGNYTWLRNAATGQCIDYGGSEIERSNVALIRIRMANCRPDGKTQLFSFSSFPEGGYLIRARPGGDWDEMQLGMEDWNGDLPPRKDDPAVLTYHYYNAPGLRYCLSNP
ncbi:sigma-70 family RNA polymerase sigma factor [Streptomyces sp. NPDC050636]|uniref:sigma-70 family RNA polymerase sigma factor n=1 Tax=Streptomyces sp. NPDC050636 TaxID=3154510 RepID=UPI00343C8644